VVDMHALPVSPCALSRSPLHVGHGRRHGPWRWLADALVCDPEETLIAAARAGPRNTRRGEEVPALASGREPYGLLRRGSVVLLVDGELVVVVRALVAPCAGVGTACEGAARAHPDVCAGLALEPELRSAGTDAAAEAARQRRERDTAADLAIDTRNRVIVLRAISNWITAWAALGGAPRGSNTRGTVLTITWLTYEIFIVHMVYMAAMHLPQQRCGCITCVLPSSRRMS
jgi:hypothetical protein